MKNCPILTSVNDIHAHAKTLPPDVPVFGVVGYPIGHSLSHILYQTAFKATSFEGTFLRFEIRPESFDRFMRECVGPKRKIKWHLGGLAVTHPYKRLAVKYTTKAHPIVEQVGALNTLRIREKEMFGFNTDPEAFLEPLERINLNFETTRFTIIGTGGVARSVCWALRNRHLTRSIRVLSREVSRARSLSKSFDLNGGAPLHTFRGHTDVLINTTPVGMQGFNPSGRIVPREVFKNVEMLGYDLITHDTLFLQDARELVHCAFNGQAMFRTQGCAQWKILTGMDAPDHEIFQALEEIWKKGK